jgi:hypothetical protein
MDGQHKNSTPQYGASPTQGVTVELTDILKGNVRAICRTTLFVLWRGVLAFV